MWCTSRGCRLQESPTHPCLGNIKMFQRVLFKSTRAQFCRGGLISHRDHSLTGGTPGIPKFWVSDCGVRRSDAGAWHGDISVFIVPKSSSKQKSWKQKSVPHGIISLEHLLLFNPAKRTGRADHEFEIKVGGSKGVECACLPPKRLLKKKLFSLREKHFCKLSFYQNNKGNFSHSLPSARVSCGLTGR